MDATKAESQEVRTRNLELRMEAMAKEPDLLRAEFRATILESEMRMKEYVDQRFSRLETRVDFQFKVVMSLHAVQIAGIIAVAVRLFQA
ncbi:hypothetical protein SAMN05518865_101505 [Duganella sp. CF458]|uniref:hypothetical protein n=1 Tax=Duganella sp. CF458 TaxID=1884368 RepID=UPI0008ED5EC9|nr:hypothetical protein [Duganella sp. CF458]SFF55914.1 hypothetical protein SAMN05518865_101505 [Duganella sp. CF458]